MTRISEGKEESLEVSLGLRGAEGLIEITAGLLVGDVLISPTTLDREPQK